MFSKHIVRQLEFIIFNKTIQLDGTFYGRGKENLQVKFEINLFYCSHTRYKDNANIFLKVLFILNKKCK